MLQRAAQENGMQPLCIHERTRDHFYMITQCMKTGAINSSEHSECCWCSRNGAHPVMTGVLLPVRR